MLVDLTTQLDQTQRLLSQLLSAKSGTHSEQLSVDQLLLFVQELNVPESEAATETQKDDDVPPGSTSNSSEDQDESRRRGRRTLPAHLKRERIRARSGGRRKALRRLQPRPAAHRRRNQRALRIHSGAVAGDRGRLQEIRVRMHGEDGGQAAAAHREERGRCIATGAGDRQQNSRPPARAPASENLQPLRRRDSGPDHGRLDAAIGAVTRSSVCSLEAVRAELEGGGD